MSGRILVGDYDGIYVIRFEGDVRVTLCGSFDHYLERMLADPEFASALVDLSGASAIDSTSLGVLAKLSIGVKRRVQRVPTLICAVPDILRILTNMGFEDVFDIVADHACLQQDLAELPAAAQLNEDEMRQRVIEAHRVLMSMNAENADTFRDLVTALEAESDQRRASRSRLRR